MVDHRKIKLTDRFKCWYSKIFLQVSSTLRMILLKNDAYWLLDSLVVHISKKNRKRVSSYPRLNLWKSCSYYKKINISMDIIQSSIHEASFSNLSFMVIWIIINYFQRVFFFALYATPWIEQYILLCARLRYWYYLWCFTQ